MPRRPLWLFLLCISVCVLAAGDQRPMQQAITHQFGISLNTGINNELFTLFIVKVHGLEVVGTEPITREQFMLQSQGVVPSKANPDQENLLRKYKVEACLHPDTMKYYRDCYVLDELWKLRFDEYPFHPIGGHMPEKGWAKRKNVPDAGQMLMLANYGLLRLSGLIRGEDVFHLLRDVGDSTWVDRYRTGS